MNVNAKIHGQKDRQGQKDKDRDKDILYHRMNAIRILTDFNEFSRIDSDPREFTRIDSDLLRFIQFFNVNFGNQFESNSCSPLIRILLQHGFDSN